MATSGDDPGAGVEPDTVVAQVRGERLAQTPDRARRGGGVQPLQYLAGAGEAADPVEGGGHVRTVVDRLVDVGEGDVGEPRGAPGSAVTVGGSASENGSGPAEAAATGPSAPARDWWIATSHSLRSWACQTIITRRPAGRSARLMLANAATGSSKNIVPNLLIARSKRSLRKAVDLCVGVLEGDVAEPLGLGQLAGTLDGGRGDVDPERTACLGRARGLPGRLPGPTSDVEDVVVELDASRPGAVLRCAAAVRRRSRWGRAYVRLQGVAPRSLHRSRVA